MRRLLVVFIFILFASLGFLFQHAVAQTAGPQLLITWRSTAYVPPGYRGHTMPTAQSNVIASVQVIDNGKVVDMSGQTIYWYLDDQFIDSGRNMPTVEFQVPPDNVNIKLNLMVRVPDYKGGLVNTIEIPVVASQAVISAPFLVGGGVPSDPFTVHALAYFFNVTRAGRLNMLWTLNGEQAPTENPLNLTIDPANVPGGQLRVQLSVRNPFSTYGLEAASASLNL